MMRVFSAYTSQGSSSS